MLAGILVAFASLLVMLFVPGVYPGWDYGAVTRTELLLVIVLFGVVYEWIMVDALARDVARLSARQDRADKGT